MKTVTKKRNIQMPDHLIENSQQFGMEQSVEVFHMLSNGLYSDKITAIIRELSENAYDSHVAAGKGDVPFYIHLPTWDDPTFYVEDWGTGMSEKAIYETYSVYFSSDKRETNSAVGTFGLGSKTPFSYTDSFTVESFYEGERMEFLCYINEEGWPSITKVFSEETTRSNGIRVSFSVLQNRGIDEFHSKAARIFRPFPVRPQCNVNLHVKEWGDEHYSGTGWTIYKSYDIDGDGVFAVQGNIEYPVNVRDIEPELEDEEMDMIRALSYQKSIILHFHIGQLRVTPSRESLSMTKRTKRNIVQRVKTLVQELRERIEADVHNASSYWEACKKYTLHKDTLYGNIHSKGLTIYYDGRTVQSRFSIPQNKKVWLYDTKNTTRSVFPSVVREKATYIYPYYETPVYYVEEDYEDFQKYLRNLKRKLKRDNGSAFVVIGDGNLDFMGYPPVSHLSEVEWVKTSEVQERKGSSSKDANVDVLWPTRGHQSLQSLVNDYQVVYYIRKDRNEYQIPDIGTHILTKTTIQSALRFGQNIETGYGIDDCAVVVPV